MGTQELNKAYPRLKREWPGYILRLTNPMSKGLPDFLITHIHCGPVFAEVKCVSDPRDIIGLEFHQAQTLDNLSCNGSKARVLCLCLGTSSWAIFHAGPLVVHYKSLRWEMGQTVTSLSPSIFLGSK